MSGIARKMQSVMPPAAGGWDISTAVFDSGPYGYFDPAEATSPKSVYMHPDGARMFVLDAISDRVHEYSLSTAWALSTATHVQSFSVTGQETSLTCMTFRPDGTQMFVCGTAGDDVNEYSLSTAWDISTATFVQSFSVLAQSAAVSGIAFKSDGTQMYITDSFTDRVYQYDLGTAWDISTAGYFNDVDISADNTIPEDVFVKPDGTKLYVLAGGAIRLIYAYDIAVPWDLRSLGTPTTLSISAQSPAPTGMTFRPDGTQMYTTGLNDDEVNEYSLSTAWDISTATFVRRLAINLQETAPTGVVFRPDGTQMFVVGSAGDDVNEYSLSTAWNISTTSFVRNFSVAAKTAAPDSLAFATDGTKMYVSGGGNIHQYNLSTPWNVSTAVFSATQVLLSELSESDITGLSFSDDGVYMYFVGATTDRVYRYALSTPWSVATAGRGQSLFVRAQDDSPKGVTFKDDGAKMYVAGLSGVSEYSLSTPWAILSASYLSELDVAQQVLSGGAISVAFKPDGTELFVAGAAAPFPILGYTISTPWDVATGAWTEPPRNYLDVSAQESNIQGVTFHPNGAQMFIAGATGDDVNEYSLSTAWDIDSATFVQSFSVSAQETGPTGVFFRPDGTQMFILGSAGDDVNEYSLSTEWDISTATFVQNFSVATQETVPAGIFFHPDGIQMFVLGSSGDDVNEYSLSTAWDISTATFVQTFSVAGQETVPAGLFFHPDGIQMFVVGTTGDDVNQYDLSVAWNISTATFVQTFDITGQVRTVTSIAFKPDGTQMYVSDTTGDAIYQYDL